MMLVGFSLPVRLSRLYIKEVPHPIMLVGFYLPALLEVLLPSVKHPQYDAGKFLSTCEVGETLYQRDALNNDASRFLPTRAVERAAKGWVKVYKNTRVDKSLLVRLEG